MLLTARACAASLALLVPLAVVLPAAAESFHVDPAIPAYAPGTAKPATGAGYLTPDGAIRIGGAVHAKFVVERANALYAKTHSGAKLTDVAAGAETAIPNLTYNRILVGSMGRPIKLLETAGFKSAFGAEPIEIKVAHAANDTSQHLATSLAVYVHRDNPITQLTTKQVAQMLTIGNAGGDFSRWGQLGLKGDWTKRLIHPLGTPQYSGFGTWMLANRLDGKPYSTAYEEYSSTDELLKRLEGVTGAWGNRRIHLYGQRDDGDFSTNLRLSRLGGMPFAGHYEPLADNAAVVQAVAQDPYGIAIVDWLDPKQAPDAIRIVPLAAEAGKPFASTAKADVANGIYQLTPAITLYVAHPPKKPIEPIIKDYLAMALSDEGQAIIARFADSEIGFLPLSADDLNVERERLKD